MQGPLSVEQLRENLRTWKRGEYALESLLEDIVRASWWVPHDETEAQANFDAQGRGFILAYTDAYMDSDYTADQWRQLTGAELTAVLVADPDFGVVFDYSYPWAVNLTAEQTGVLQQTVVRLGTGGPAKPNATQPKAKQSTPR